MRTLRQHVESRLEALRQERSSWMPHWSELSEHLLPRRGRFLGGEGGARPNQGGKRNGRIVNGTATIALRTLQSGLSAGVTSPARPWFKLATPDPELAEWQPVKLWLERVETLMQAVFDRSNLYPVLQAQYEELGCFGTAVLAVFEDRDDVIRVRGFTAGEYMIAQDHKGRVETFYREYAMTVAQLVEQFGLEAVSGTVRGLWDRGGYDQWVEVVHAIEPNRPLDGVALEADKPWRSLYFEKGQTGGGAAGKALAERGFEEFPLMAPRWHLMSGDIYGRSPAMDALGDVKQLQNEERRKAEAIEKLVRPPMIAPTSLQKRAASILPGSITYVDVQQGQAGFRPAYQFDPQIQPLMLDIEKLESRINRAFYADLFLMMVESDRRQITATEVAERHEEKLLALGPVLERLHKDLLRPLIDRSFAILARAELLPPAPPELQGGELEVAFVSLLAQAQKAVDSGSIERFAGFVGRLAQANPEALDKLDFDQAVELYGARLSVPPSLIRGAEAVAALRAGRARQQQLAQAGQAVELAGRAAEGVKALGETPTGGETLLSGLLQAAGGRP
ncbi:Bacteriophage head to tail connecting protein [Tistlia consotensis]|uniref:Bacteriophage head to tail connecting protein n=1 Tax=Tistlia consotensis USBA 355 TaxID=560819 RepID=A0A1Y6CIG5_9PROT|nr:portal protein [Tistlia consotensis]SMF64640.1 Bacteriophage head to tail connecting protein [Tistlia consotensis USBA 355]SNR97107.1 Bacteriophage head to tail connecting protein [Tistlia consotensis]